MNRTTSLGCAEEVTCCLLITTYALTCGCPTIEESTEAPNSISSITFLCFPRNCPDRCFRWLQDFQVRLHFSSVSLLTPTHISTHYSTLQQRGPGESTLIQGIFSSSSPSFTHTMKAMVFHYCCVQELNELLVMIMEQKSVIFFLPFPSQFSQCTALRAPFL